MDGAVALEPIFSILELCVSAAYPEKGGSVSRSLNYNDCSSLVD